MRETVMQVGDYARDAALAKIFAQQGTCELHLVAQHPNPSLLAAAEVTGGQLYVVSDTCNAHVIGQLVMEIRPTLFIVNKDAALEADIAGVVRKASPDTLVASPDRASSQPEWDKLNTRLRTKRLKPEYNPHYHYIRSEEELEEAIRDFEARGLEAAVKPQNLAGGRGVKVMGKHLQDYNEVRAYVRQVLNDPTQEGVLLEEKFEGLEFNLQSETDGLFMTRPPVTVDYPYRDDGDVGPGTGGTGSFTMQEGAKLPFLTAEEYDEVATFMQDFLADMQHDGLDFKGTLYGSFIKTKDGIKLIEFNCRRGCPEGVNIAELYQPDVDLLVVQKQIATRGLQPDSIRYQKLASAVIYAFPPEYAREGLPTQEHTFRLDEQIIRGLDCRPYFAAAKRVGENAFRTVGASRTVAFAGLGETPWAVRARLHEAIKAGMRGSLVFRSDIADEVYINRMTL